MTTVLTHLGMLVLGLPVGAYLHYRYGSKVKQAIASIETRVS